MHMSNLVFVVVLVLHCKDILRRWSLHLPVYHSEVCLELDWLIEDIGCRRAFCGWTSDSPRTRRDPSSSLHLKDHQHESVRKREDQTRRSKAKKHQIAREASLRSCVLWRERESEIMQQNQDVGTRELSLRWCYVCYRDFHRDRNNRQRFSGTPKWQY